jgi:hypothetical protein
LSRVTSSSKPPSESPTLVELVVELLLLPDALTDRLGLDDWLVSSCAGVAPNGGGLFNASWVSL